MNDQKDLLNYHMAECRDRYLSIEKRLQRIEALIITLLMGSIGFALEILFKFEGMIK